MAWGHQGLLQSTDNALGKTFTKTLLITQNNLNLLKESSAIEKVFPPSQVLITAEVELWRKRNK